LQQIRPPAGSSAAPASSANDSLGGYIQGERLVGYAWTDVTGAAFSIAPEDFSDQTDFSLCTSGEVAAGYENFAMLGWNLDQGKGADELRRAITPTSWCRGAAWAPLTPAPPNGVCPTGSWEPNRAAS